MNAGRLEVRTPGVVSGFETPCRNIGTQPIGTVEVKNSKNEVGLPVINLSFTFPDGIQTLTKYKKYETPEVSDNMAAVAAIFKMAAKMR
ncbi:hypothetical protein MAR_004293 [Mya arenaria]|uniref:Uncharacterized protein n=1 Tax=Mya arenaria TaxID=6604 RepID=A0ABY7EW55_MYAAR|nr:hypothetical protein MAR_004293 [Mya arenaria]